MKVFCIIVAYYGVNYIKNNVKEILSCFAQNRLIVIDNGSKDGIREFLQDNYPNVHFVQLDKNYGFGKANNFGISLAYEYGFDAVFLLNQDAYLKKKSFEMLIERAQNYNNFGVLSPVHLNGDGTLIDKHFIGYIGDKNQIGCRELLSDMILNNDFKGFYELNFVNAAGWLINKQCLNKIGGFNPLFFHYGEDVNFLQRVRFFGFSIGVVPDSFLYHNRDNFNKHKNVSSQVEEEFRSILVRVLDINQPEFPKKYFNKKIKLNKIIFLKALVKFDFYEMNYRKTLIKKLVSNKVGIQEAFYRDRRGGLNYIN